MEICITTSIPRDASDAEIIYLKPKSWDDWYKYNTLFELYFSERHQLHYIGEVKIARNDIRKKDDNGGQYDLPFGDEKKFEALDDRFFSIGQDENYYENLKSFDDNTRINILQSLRDAVFNLDIYEQYENLDVMADSLLRYITPRAVIKNQFHRIATGGAKLTSYHFNYRLPQQSSQSVCSIDFRVNPDDNPATNMHAIIGRNGVGKTWLIKNIINASMSGIEGENDYGRLYDCESNYEGDFKLFSNVVCIAYSAFDDFYKIREQESPFVKLVGLFSNGENQSKDQPRNGDLISNLTLQFIKAYKEIQISHKKEMFNNAISHLSADSIFDEFNECIKDVTDADSLSNHFKKLSSGHKIILLSIVNIIRYTVEKSLVILDEPENHLHPPLLSSYLRALSDILIKKNAVAIIATHSPIVLQEIPKNCIWKLQRYKRNMSFNRLDEETFGTNLNSILREIFGLEIDNTGCHAFIRKIAQEADYDFNRACQKVNIKLGDQIATTLRIIIAKHNKTNEENTQTDI